jgi:CRISPR-associated protein Csx17
MRHTHDAIGCRPEPLGSYLKALGLLRLVGEQADPAAAGAWGAGTFTLTTRLDRDDLLDFLLDEYAPTPLVSPWNGGSGFYPGDKKAREEIALIEASALPRLRDYLTTLAVARELVAEAQADGWEPKDPRHKERFVQRCRARFPDRAVAWLDAAVVLTGSGLTFPTLLGGSGGNLGRLDLSANFLARLADVLCLRPGRGGPTRATSRAWLAAALFRTPAAAVKASIGQFDPVAASGPTSSAFGAADALVNPWDVVLLLEGSLLFAGAAARRLGMAAPGTAAMPFMVASTPIGYPSSAPGENAKGEVWAPLWSRSATPAEVARLIGEGRSTWNRQQAGSGLDFARAAAGLGVDRGIDAFARHALVERHGQSMLAVPVGRFAVTARPQVPVLGQLDRWLDRVRSTRDLPAAVASALRGVESAMFAVAQRGGGDRLARVLVAAADLEAGIARSGRLRATLLPVQGLAARDWLPQVLGDRPGPEATLAAALASLRDLDGTDLRSLLRPVARSGGGGARRLTFTVAPAPVLGLGRRPVVEVLADALVLRTRQAEERATRREGDGPEQEASVGVVAGHDRGDPASAGAVAALLRGGVDEVVLARLLAGMLLLSWPPDGPDEPLGARGEAVAAHLASPAYALLAPFFQRRAITPGPGRDLFRPRVQPAWPARLRAGRVRDVVDEAHRRMRIGGHRPAVRAPTPGAGAIAGLHDAVPGARLAAALLVPIPPADARALLLRIAPTPLTDEDAGSAA